MRLKVLAIVVLVAISAGALIVSFGGLSAAAENTRYLTRAAAMGDVTDEVAATGAVAAASTWGLAFGAAPHLVGATANTGAGPDVVVKAVQATVGKTVKTGEVLATADTTALSQAMTAALNSWRIARIQQTTAEENLTTAQTGGVTSAIRQASIALYNAQNQAAQTKQAFLDARTARDTSGRITAPVDGTVTAVNITAGQEKPSGDAITIASTAFQITADVAESDVTKIQVGQAATVTVTAVGGTADGTVTAIAPTSTTTSGNVVAYPVTITLARPPAGIRPGMTADVTITIASATNVLWVPAAAVSGTGGSYMVRTLDATGAIQSKDVTVGLVTSSRVQITSGLNAGDTVITGTATTQQTTTSTGGGGGFVVPGGGAFPGGGGRNFGRGGGG